MTDEEAFRSASENMKNVTIDGRSEILELIVAGGLGLDAESP